MQRYRLTGRTISRTILLHERFVYSFCQMNFLPPEMEQSTSFNMSAFVIFGFPKIVKFFRVTILKDMLQEQNSKLQLIVLVLGILVYRRFFRKHQRTIKDEMDGNQPKD